jgi:hypothetical protein
MMYVILHGGQVEELREAVATAIRGDDFVCLDETGREVARYNRLTVLMFGHNSELRRYAMASGDGATSPPIS